MKLGVRHSLRPQQRGRRAHLGSGHSPNGVDSLTCWLYLALWVEARALTALETLTARGDPIVQMRWGLAWACLAPLRLPGASLEPLIACRVGVCLLAALGPGARVQRPWVGILAAVSLASLPWGLSQGEEEQLYGTGPSAWRARGETAIGAASSLAYYSFLEQGLSSQCRAWMSQDPVLSPIVTLVYPTVKTLCQMGVSCLLPGSL